MRIALIHALAHSIAPINLAFSQIWPDATRVNLLDDSLSADLAANAGVLDDAMHRRFEALADYAVNTGADGILFTCSAFGSCIEQVARKHGGIPVLKPNEAMIAEALKAAQSNGMPIGLIASFAPTLVSMPPEFPRSATLRMELPSMRVTLPHMTRPLSLRRGGCKHRERASLPSRNSAWRVPHRRSRQPRDCPYSPHQQARYACCNDDSAQPKPRVLSAHHPGRAAGKGRRHSCANSSQ
jgi:hypothetical protein